MSKSPETKKDMSKFVIATIITTNKNLSISFFNKMNIHIIPSIKEIVPDKN
jgi:hypothetical protein